MLNVLIVTYQFPPMGGTAVQRVRSLVKYLPYYGVRPIVLTANNGADQLQIDSHAQIPTNIHVYRTFCLDLDTIFLRRNSGKYRELTGYYSQQQRSRLARIADLCNRMIVPDIKLLWLPFAFNKAESIFSTHQIDAVFSTSPRQTAHLIAYLISKKYNVPMIADFRDPWTQGKLGTARPSPFKSIDLLLERTIIQHSRKVISVTEEIKKDFVRRYAAMDKSKFVVVTNGFDREEFVAVEAHKYHHYTILYAGKNYDGRGNVPWFLDQLNVIRTKNGLDIRFHYIGSDHQTIAAHKRTHNLDFVEVTPFISHDRVIGHMKGASAFYLCQHGERIPPLTGKLFEYIGVQRPTIAMTQNNSEMAQILAKTESGLAFESAEDSRLEEFLKRDYASYCNGKASNLDNNDLIMEYDRKHLAGKIASLIQDVAKS